MSTNEKTNLAIYMKKPEVLTKFMDILGDNGKSYVQSVLIAISASPDLMKCTNESIFRSALRAASLGLSCDPALKQAWLVPYNRKIKTSDGSEKWIKEAQFQIHYRGLYTLAMRTGKYWQINVSPIYAGQRVLLDPLSGMHAVQEDNGFVGEHPGKRPGYIDITERRRKEDKIIGWLGYFKTKKGFEKSVWMSCLEIDDHARKYVRDYDKNPNWNDPDKRQIMEMKTVLRQLMSWADLTGTDNIELIEALKEEEPIDVPSEDAPSLPVPLTIEQARQTVVTLGGKERFIGELTIENLNSLWLDDNTSDEIKEAVCMVLSQDLNVDVPDKPKQSMQKNMKELGF